MERQRDRKKITREDETQRTERINWSSTDVFGPPGKEEEEDRENSNNI